MRQIHPFRLTLVLIIAGEVLSLVWLGQALGILPTFGILLLAGILGVALIRRSGVGLMNLMRAGQTSPEQLSDVAAGSLLSGLAGLFLLMPGLVSDVVALLLLLPFTRTRLARLFQFNATIVRPRPFGQPPGDIIEAEAVEIIEPDRRLD